MTNNILYKNNDVICFNKYHVFNNKTTDSENRINLIDNKLLTNPKYICLSLFVDKDNSVKFNIFDGSDKFKWSFKNDCIKYKYHKYLAVRDDKLVVSEKKQNWELVTHDHKTFIKSDDKFISSDIRYNIFLSENIKYALNFCVDDNLINHIKTPMKLNFEINNIINKLDVSDFIFHIPHDLILEPEYVQNVSTKKYNIGIILAAGTSSRFINSSEIKESKQLYPINSIPVINYSIEIMRNILDEIIIVTNSNNYNKIKDIAEAFDCNINVVINDVNCRTRSINAGLEYIKNTKKYMPMCANVIIHDSARPFVKENHIKTLIESSSKYLYSQYCLKLVNGLCKKDYIGYNIVNRDDYIEICTPICINYNLFDFVFTNYMNSTNSTNSTNIVSNEFIPILDILRIEYNMIEGKYNYLKKITMIDDLEN